MSTCEERDLHKKHQVMPRTHQDELHKMKPIKDHCKDHPDKEIVMFCNNCKIQCCVECATGTFHQCHSFGDIEITARQARYETQAHIDTLQNNILPSSEKVFAKVVKGITQCGKDIEQVRQESKVRFQILRDQINQAENEWMFQLDKIQNDHQTDLQYMRDKADKQIKQTKDLIDTCKSKVKVANDIEILSFRSKCCDFRDLEPMSLPPLQRITFRPTAYKIPALPDLIGRVDKVQEKEEDDEDLSFQMSANALKSESLFDTSMVQVAVIKTMNGICADTLLHNDSGEVLISDRDKKTFTRYDQNFENLKTVKTEFKILDMVQMSSGDIIATDDNKRVVKIAQSGKISTLFNTAPGGAWGVCVNNRQEVVVGQYRPRRIVVYSQDGSHIQQEIKKDEIGKPLFTNAITQVKQRKNGDYVVSDRDRIVCFSGEGKHKWEHKVKQLGEFTPDVYGLVCDQYDNVIIAEFNNDQISLLDREGRLVKTLLTKEDGIRVPWSLSIDKSGHLWIGQGSSVIVLKYVK